ncbi:MAG: ABC transporter substrate-binding protein [Reyranella sp.]|uniref:ABC transporter substrate-binding protein n=1 Tax=Reyranella sp. TaxID=1929291 RepID=UPI001AD46BA6|nr:ABC transporter substrate-binding protein [Reyranella sp.]MBN9087852.1 ABC transporter substrate-binding protein [Reyranella sp.]
MTSVSRRVFGAGALATGLTIGRPLLAEEPRRGGTLVATWGGGEPQACYVPSGGGPGPTFSSSKLLERLARRQRDGAFAGELAESWKPADDFRSYTVKLREGVKFHDGKPMTADDVAYSVDEVWKKYAATASMADYSGVETPDAGTVVISYSRPMPEFTFASLLSGSVNYVLPRHVYAGSDALANPANDAPIGTGPWKLKQWVRGSHIELVRNDDYWRPGFPYMDRLVLRFVRDPAGRAAALEAGEIQVGVFNPVSPTEIKRLTNGKLVATTEGYEEAVWATTMECNCRKPLFAKREVRQAMFLAIDRGQIARTVYYGYARPGTGPIFSPNTAFYTPDIYSTAFDPKKAAALLDAAGYKRNGKASRFTVNLVAGGWFPENAKVGALVKQALEDIGVAVNLAAPDRAAAIKRLYTDYDFDLAISNQANPSEPVPTTTQYYTSDGIKKGVPFRNASGFSSPETDALVDRIRVETDPATRKAMVVDFQKTVAEEAFDLPLVELDTFTVAAAKVQNHTTDPNILATSWHDIWLAA